MLDEILIEVRRHFDGRVLFQCESGYVRVVLGDLIDDFLRSKLSAKLNLIAGIYGTCVILEDLLIRVI